MKYVYETKLSEHIARDNIGQLICTDVPIARSGSQDYLEDEINGNGSTRIIKLQRPWQVVKESAPSFEGKPFIKGHPADDVTVENIKALQGGHVQNVRADDEKEMLIADIVVSDPKMIELIETKKMRDISCGYFYSAEGNVVTKIVGEHVALVEEGRAGNTRILDALRQRFDTFLTEIPVTEVKVGDWLYLMNADGDYNFVEVIKIIKRGTQRLLLISDHISKPIAFTFDENDVVKGLIRDIVEVEYKDPTEEEIKKEISQKLGDTDRKIRRLTLNKEKYDRFKKAFDYRYDFTTDQEYNKPSIAQLNKWLRHEDKKVADAEMVFVERFRLNTHDKGTEIYQNMDTKEYTATVGTYSIKSDNLDELKRKIVRRLKKEEREEYIKWIANDARPKTKDSKKADDSEKVSLYNYGIFNKDDELVAYVAIDRNMEKGIVTQRSLAAVFTSNDWEEILEKSYIKSLKKEIANFGYIKALRNKTWLN